MREVALLEQDAVLLALVEDVERTGEPVLLTRGGKPIATLIPSSDRSLGARLLARMEERGRRYPQSAAALSWESLKAELDEDRA